MGSGQGLACGLGLTAAQAGHTPAPPTSLLRHRPALLPDHTYCPSVRESKPASRPPPGQAASASRPPHLPPQTPPPRPAAGWPQTCVKPSLMRRCLKVRANCSSSSRSLGSSGWDGGSKHLGGCGCERCGSGSVGRVTAW